MPCEHTLSAYELSLLKKSEESKKIIGFDGSYSLPTEQRILLEAQYLGRQVQLMRVIKHLNLDETAAKVLFYGLISEPEPQSVEEVEKFFNDLRRFR